jgi:hypothetical protein
MGSLARFENKNILFYFIKRCSPLQRCSCKFQSRRIGSRSLGAAAFSEMTNKLKRSLGLDLESRTNVLYVRPPARGADYLNRIQLSKLSQFAVLNSSGAIHSHLMRFHLKLSDQNWSEIPSNHL